MDPLDAIRRAQATALVDRKGRSVELRLLPGLSADELEDVEAEVGLPLPHELRGLLAHTAGIEGSALDGIDFSGRTMDVGVGELFPAGLPVAADGFGNFWVVDLTPEEPESTAVFYLCHDPPVVVYQAPSLGRFLHEALRLSSPPHESLVEDVRERAAHRVWHAGPRGLDRVAALAADEELRAFAGSLDDRYTFVDLRDPSVGDGFPWGSHGPRTEIVRHGYVRLFAYAPPERRPGILRRVLGRA